MAEEEEIDDDISKILTVEELECAVDNIAAYLERIIKGEWQCTVESEKPTATEIVWYLATPQKKCSIHAEIGPPAYDDNEMIVMRCTGLMRSPLESAPVAEEFVQLRSFGELLDYVIVHLCPVMCVPRALYYTVNTMKMCISPPELVDDHITIAEDDGEFTLENPKGKRACRIGLIAGADGDVELHYFTGAQDEAKIIKGPTANIAARKNFDFVQHAFRRDLAVQYIQHPSVAAAITALFEATGLQGGELRGLMADRNPSTGKKESGGSFGGGGAAGG